MFKNLKIGVRLGIGFGVVVLLLAITAVVSVERLGELNAAMKDITEGRMPKIEMAMEIEKNALTMGLALRTLLLSDDKAVEKSQLEVIAKARQRNNEIFDQLKPLINTETGKALFEKLSQARIRYGAALDTLIPLADSASPQHSVEKASAFLFNDFPPIAGSYVEATREFSDFQKKSAAQTGSRSVDEANSARLLVIALSTAAVLIALLFAWFITRTITRPINAALGAATRLADGDLTVKLEVDSKDEVGLLMSAMQNMIARLTQIISEVRNAADNLSNAAGQVSATAQSLSQSSSEQAASVEETTASMEQMSASITQNTDNAKVTDSMAAKAASEAVEGGDAVTRTVDDMKSIAGKIGIIDDIAYQTNLLALNAAIEAARAGEHGKGFAVVAAEVRKLAERSQVAAKEIGDLADSSVKQAEYAGTLLSTMVPNIRKTSDLVQEIAVASTEQTTGVGQINGAMLQLNQATQQNASASEELAATAEELGSQAEQLQQTMTFFRLADEARRQPAAQQTRSTLDANPPGLALTGTAAFADGDFERF